MIVAGQHIWEQLNCTFINLQNVCEVVPVCSWLFCHHNRSLTWKVSWKASMKGIPVTIFISSITKYGNSYSSMYYASFAAMCCVGFVSS